MNKHVEKAKELRNATPMVHNCAQTIMEVYAISFICKMRAIASTS